MIMKRWWPFSRSMIFSFYNNQKRYKMSYPNHYDGGSGGQQHQHQHHQQQQQQQYQHPYSSNIQQRAATTAATTSNGHQYTTTQPNFNQTIDQQQQHQHQPQQQQYYNNPNNNYYNNNDSITFETNLSFGHLYDNLMRDESAKRLAMWIAVMLCFTLYEIFYGAYLESLGLVSDGFHQLFDCIGFVISLLSMLVSKKGTNREYTYGYDRYEILGVFSNGCFLLFVSFFLLLESVERILEPPHMHNHGRVISVALFSLVINVVGILFFRQHSLKHSNNKKSDDIGNNSNNYRNMIYNDRIRQDNFVTIFTHIIVDSCTSLGVILSTLLSQLFGFDLSDSLISIIIAFIIIYQVIPICKRTAFVLLQTTPDAIAPQIKSANLKVSTMHGVVKIGDSHFWTQSQGNTVGSMVVYVKDDKVNQQALLKEIRTLYTSFVNDITIQIQVEHKGHGDHGHKKNHDEHKNHPGHSHSNTSSVDHGHGHDHGHDDHGHDDHGHGHSHNHGQHGHSH
ncbi:putative zinc transporter [Cavenderia fasciculata]|uniref:Zinc transporter n=1 Tax=Cavenderia fasciculata TaxID=261658 RepID=F4QAN8_CACFS|nr:putative zinc transporter [Cavenderia fasciculata]EGG15757.1 putative zinc transporter [Cavenderia fasciculata]|eukprot:XP_004354504.1 putative zinc transporter [Cavenderia fasciculata]